MAQQPVLQAIQISKRFGLKIALDSISFAVFPGETLAVVGPSGSGKTTLLRIVAGLERPTQGSVKMEDKDVTEVPPENRNIGFVFQQYALFPHMSVYDNLSFPLRIRHLSSRCISERVMEALTTIGMEQFRLRKPTSLSSGERQRVAIMRAVISEPPILLLDEPFAALDRRLVEQLQEELWRLREAFRIAMVLVTHDLPFAMSISKQILILKDGQVQQTGTPREVFEHPEGKFVASFLGEINFIRGKLAETNNNGLGAVRLSSGETLDVLLPSESCMLRGQDVTIAIRPNRIRLNSRDTPSMLKGVVRVLHYHGAHVMVEVVVNDDIRIYSELNSCEATNIAEDREVVLCWEKNDASIIAK